MRRNSRCGCQFLPPNNPAREHLRLIFRRPLEDAEDVRIGAGAFHGESRVTARPNEQWPLNPAIRSGTRLALPAAMLSNNETDMSAVIDSAVKLQGAEEKALVLFSGGQDSSTCLAWTLEKFAAVETIGFEYGQRHRIELECGQTVRAALTRDFPEWGRRLGPDHRIDLSVLGDIGETALTHESAIEMGENGLPTTFVPGRNIVFLTIAAALAYRRGIRHIVAGMCETDYSGYPDCRDDTIKALQVALNLGMAKRFVLHTPLMWIDKAATWQLARELGGDGLVSLIIDHTHSCYLGERVRRHDWGFGCGTCPACVLRRNGYRKFTALANST